VVGSISFQTGGAFSSDDSKYRTWNESATMSHLGFFCFPARSITGKSNRRALHTQ